MSAMSADYFTSLTTLRGKAQCADNDLRRFGRCSPKSWISSQILC
jgi:hypothetical protein